MEAMLRHKPRDIERLNHIYAALGQPEHGRAGALDRGVEMVFAAPPMLYERPSTEVIQDLRAGRPVRESPYGSQWRDRRFATSVAVPSVGAWPVPHRYARTEREMGRKIRRLKARLAAKAVAPDVRVEESYLYFTRFYAAGVFVLGDDNNQYFHAARGQPATNAGYVAGVGNLSDRETNMTDPQRVPNGRNMVLNQMGVSYHNTAANVGDLHQLYEAGSLIFHILNVNVFVELGPSRLWTAGAGLSGFASTTVAATTLLGANSGIPSPAHVRRFRIPRTLESGKNFRFIYRMNRLLNPITNANYSLVAAVEVTWWWWGVLSDVQTS